MGPASWPVEAGREPAFQTRKTPAVDVGTLTVGIADGDCAPDPPRIRLPGKKYRVPGRVIDTRGPAVTNAVIGLSGFCIGFGARSGPDGTFLIRTVWPGDYFLLLQGPGFLPVSQPTEIGKPPKDLNLGNIVVDRAPILQPR